MKLELKNVKINEAFSEETLMFKADLYVNGKKIAYAENDGRGGCTFYREYSIEYLKGGLYVVRLVDENGQTKSVKLIKE